MKLIQIKKTKPLRINKNGEKQTLTSYNIDIWMNPIPKINISFCWGQYLCVVYMKKYLDTGCKHPQLIYQEHALISWYSKKNREGL